MNKLIEWLITDNKAIRILIGVLSTLWIYAICQMFLDKWTSIYCAVFLWFFFSVLKKLYDVFTRNSKSKIQDIFIVGIGVILACIPLIII